MSEDRVKSALERAMERAESLGKISADELKRLESAPLGNAMAARYLKEEGFDLDAELAKTKGTGNRKWVLEGAQETLLANITLPYDPAGKNISRKALEGLAIIKDNKKAVKAVAARIDTLFTYYEQARGQLMGNLRKQVEARMAELQKSMKYQIAGAAKAEMETQQQIQEEVRAAVSQLDSQYRPTLEEHKKELRRLT
ncbi:MAG: hypothetical protein HYY29_06350 [Chloroflexi bacterium]|nr:hypothetical protein [Chloroflexota bacterium]